MTLSPHVPGALYFLSAIVTQEFLRCTLVAWLPTSASDWVPAQVISCVKETTQAHTHKHTETHIGEGLHFRTLMLCVNYLTCINSIFNSFFFLDVIV